MKKSFVCEKKIVAVFENQVVGTVDNVMLSRDSRRVVGLLGKEQNSGPFFVETRRIFAFGENAIMLRNSTYCQKTYKTFAKPFYAGASVLSIDGLSYGVLSELEFDEKGHSVKFLTDTGKVILPSQVVCEDKEMMIFSEDGNKKLHHFKPRTKMFAQKDEQEIMVKVFEEQNKPAVDENEKPQEEEPKIHFNAKAAVPSRILSSNDMLLGKKVITDIVGLRNEIILRKGQIITERHITLSKQHGKMRELMLLSE